jgi:hypothetical protein
VRRIWPGVACRHEITNPAIARYYMMLNPFHQKLCDIDGHGHFAGRRAILHLPHSRSQLPVRLLVLSVSRVFDTLHELLFVCEVITRVIDQARQKVYQHGLAISFKHSPMQALGEHEELLVFFVDLPNAHRVVRTPLEHRPRRHVSHLDTIASNSPSHISFL